MFQNKILPHSRILFFLKKFELLARWSYLLFLWSVEKFHIAKLFVCNAKNTNVSIGRKIVFYSFYMNFGIFATWAVPQIYRKLKHCKAVCYKFVSKNSIVFTVFFGFGRQIEKYKYPHNSIFTKTLHTLKCKNLEIFVRQKHMTLSLLDYLFLIYFTCIFTFFNFYIFTFIQILGILSFDSRPRNICRAKRLFVRRQSLEDFVRHR